VPDAQHVLPQCPCDVARLFRIQRRTSGAAQPARPRRAGPTCCRQGPGGAGSAGAAQVLDALRLPARPGRDVLVHWAGRDASGDTLEPLEWLINCEAALIAFKQATGRALPRPAVPAPPPPAAAAPRRRRRHFSRLVSPSTQLRRGTWGRRSSRWACSWSTGGRTMAGSAARSPIFARAARSRTWWRTRAKSRRCAARRTRCLTPPPTVPDGCCSLLPPRPPASWPGFGPADPDLTFSVVSNSSQFGPARSGPTAAVP
jgi:hypothetical protein